MSTQKIAPFVLAAAVLAASVVVLGVGGTPVSASSRKGALDVTKNCNAYDFTAGSSCTITQSNVPELSGATVFYSQAANTPAGMLDSNIVVVAGPGDWAVGRCTLDLSTFVGLCTISDGVGRLAGFEARIGVSPAGGLDFFWRGTYSFNLKDK